MPGRPLAGLNPVIVRGPTAVKLVGCRRSDGVESVIVPVVAPVGTRAVTFTLVHERERRGGAVELHGVHPREVRSVDGHGGPDASAGRVEARHSWACRHRR